MDWPSGSAPRRRSATRAGTRRPTSTRPACARWSRRRSPARALMRLIFVTQYDRRRGSDPRPTVDELRALARRVRRARRHHRSRRAHDLPANSPFRTFGAGTEPAAACATSRARAAALRRGRPDAVVAHMSPFYLILAAPLPKLVRVPLALWYTHWAIDRTLKLATGSRPSAQRRPPLLPDRRPEGARDRSRHRRFQFGAREAAPPGNGTLRLLALGRTSPSKAFPTLVRACALPARRGSTSRSRSTGPRRRTRSGGTGASSRHWWSRKGSPARWSSGSRCHARPFRSSCGASTPWSTRRGAASGGALDKVVYESAACAVPVFACNPFRRVSRRSPRRAPLRERRRRRSGARPPSFAASDTAAGRPGPRAAPPRRDRPLRRQLGGRGRRDGTPARD